MSTTVKEATDIAVTTLQDKHEELMGFDGEGHAENGIEVCRCAVASAYRTLNRKLQRSKKDVGRKR